MAKGGHSWRPQGAGYQMRVELSAEEVDQLTQRLEFRGTAKLWVREVVISVANLVPIFLLWLELLWVSSSGAVGRRVELQCDAWNYRNWQVWFPLWPGE